MRVILDLTVYIYDVIQHQIVFIDVYTEMYSWLKTLMHINDLDQQA